MHVPLFRPAPITVVLHYLAKRAARGPSLLPIPLGSSGAYNHQYAASSPLARRPRAIAAIVQTDSPVPHWLVQGLGLSPVVTRSLPAG